MKKNKILMNEKISVVKSSLRKINNIDLSVQIYGKKTNECNEEKFSINWYFF